MLAIPLCGRGGSRILVWKGHWQGVLRDGTPQRGVRGRVPVRVWGRSPKKTTYGEEKNKSI